MRTELTEFPRTLVLIGAATLVMGIFMLGPTPFAAGLISEPWDKLAHFLLYGTLTALLCGALPKYRVAWIAVIVVLIGAADEGMQDFWPGRSADVADWITDALAAISVVALVAFRRSR
jgi:VanZ family protein